jgi:hypothetical protein
MAFLFAACAMAADRSLTGNWKITVSVNGEDHVSTCTFQQDGEKVTGTCKGETGEGPATGQVQGDKITLSNQLPFNGDTLTLSFAGAFTSDTQMKGSVNIAPFDVSGDFVGTKVPPAGDK